MNDYECLTNPDVDGSCSVLAPKHDEETRRRAAKVLVETCFEPRDADTETEAVEMLAARATAVSFTQHASTPTDEQGCGCENVGWWCESPGNGGDTRDFWHFAFEDIEDAREVAEQVNPVDLPDHVPADAEVTS